jgi:parallel beta-helix repeat protein
MNNVHITDGRIVFNSTNLVMNSVTIETVFADLDINPDRPSLIWGKDGYFLMDSCMLSGNNTGEGINIHSSEAFIMNSRFYRTPDAIELISVDSGLVSGNYVSFSKDDAVDLNDCRNVLISNNCFINNGDKGISVGVDKKGRSQNINITNNIFYKNNVGCEVKDSSFATLTGNIFYDLPMAIVVKQKDQGYELGGHVKVHKNVFYQSGNQTIFEISGNSKVDSSGGNLVIRDSDRRRDVFLVLDGSPFMMIPSKSSSPFKISMSKNGSSLRIVNQFPYDVDLGNVQVFNKNKETELFSIPPYTILKPNQSVVLFWDNKPSDWSTMGTFFYCKSLKDHVVLRDRAGNFIAEYSMK